MDFPKSLLEAGVRFSDPDYALAAMVELRWPNGVTCPICTSKRHSFLKTRRIWKCLDCKKQFSVKLGTIFEDSALGLDKWLMAIWINANAKNGVSSHEMARALKVTQKSAWFMQHRIRLAMKANSFEKLTGTVEVDETFVGGKIDRKKPENRSGRGSTGKQPVFGILQRNGEVRTFAVEGIKKGDLQPIIQANVEPGSNLYSDKHGGYHGLADQYTHETVNHLDVWAIGDIHTNNIESYWNLFKRCIKGTWIRPSKKHLFRFAADQEFRFNWRKLDDCGRFLVATSQVEGKRIMYKDLIGKKRLTP